MEDERTEAITTGVKEDFVDTEIKTDKNDLPSFKDYYKSNNEEEEIESISEDFLTIKTLQFGSNKWAFQIDDSSSKWMVIEDEVFLKQVQNKEKSFYDGDILKCRIKTISSIKDGKPHKDYFIQKIIEHKSVKKQEKINF